MPVDIVNDPIGDPRWAALLDRHPAASIFHTPGWLGALRTTYGYEPFAVTSSAGQVLQDGIVACRIKGWTSHRLVSLPFSDHCEPLLAGRNDGTEMVAAMVREARNHRRGSLELRPRSGSEAPFESAAHSGGLEPGERYCLHHVDLRRDLADIFRGFHHSSTRRAIRRAEREGLSYEAGTSDRLIVAFHRLLRMSRRRHGLPPQPIAWFRNLTTSLGRSVTVHLASKDGQPIAGILTLSFKRTTTYKYGGSDAAHHSLGAMPFLFWRVIQDAHSQGCVDLDLGRSNLNQPGLITFKDHLGAARSTLTYYRYPAPGHERAVTGWMSRAGRGVLARLPDSALDLAGRLIYRHLG